MFMLQPRQVPSETGASGQALAQADVAVALEHVRADAGGDLVPSLRSAAILPSISAHPSLGLLAVLLDRGPQRLHVGVALGQQLLLGLDGLDQLGDLALAVGQALAR
jgi:hypothetical protein